MITNQDRALNAERTLAFYADIVNSSEDMGTNIADLLADLLHLCNIHGIDLHTELDRAEAHYAEELRSPG